MVIRCERCSTMYELDESLLAPNGSEVQCTKCQHVFVAFPPRSAGRTLVGMPAEPPLPEPKPEPRAAQPPAPPPPPAPPQPATSARVPRSGAPAVYRPANSAATVGRAPVLKRDTVGTFEARLRWSARWRWLAPAIAVGLAVAAGGSWLLLARRGDPGATRTHAEALALMALDDAASLDEAAARLGDAVRRMPSLKAVAGDRALALALRAGSLLEERDALAAKVSVRTEERDRLRREGPAGWEEAERAAASEVAALEPEIRSREDRARNLSSAAAEQLRALQSDVGDTPEVARAVAVLHVIQGDRDQGQKNVRAGRERARRDPWLDLVDGWMDARDPDRAIRERALVRLGALAAARPDLLRGRYLLARAQASLGRRPEALATLEGVLTANPRHEAARRLRDELTAPPPPAPPAPAPAPAAKVSPHPRKSVPQSDPGASVPPAGAEPPAGSTGGAPVFPLTTPWEAAPTPREAAPVAPAQPPQPSAPPAGAPPAPVRRAPRTLGPGEPDGSHGG